MIVSHETETILGRKVKFHRPCLAAALDLTKVKVLVDEQEQMIEAHWLRDLIRAFGMKKLPPELQESGHV